jgi:hypothetical protein
VEDEEVKGGAAAFGELELDVFVEEVEEHGRGDAEGEAEEEAAGAGWGPACGGGGRAGLLAEDADLFDAFGRDEFCEAVSVRG